MRTVALDDTWDLVVTGGNLASLDGGAAIAQDVASAVRLFRGELWYDTTQGVPYFETILGKFPPPGVMSAKFVAAAMTVPEVLRVRCALDPLGPTRGLTGSLTITDTRGQTTGLALPWYVQAVRSFP